MIAAPPRPPRPTVVYQPRNHCRDVFALHDSEVALSGPAGTGKTRANLEKLNACAVKYDRFRGLMLRKTRTSLTQSGMVTMDRHVRPTIHGARFNSSSQEYRYPNGSVIVVAGMDKASKVLSSEYDVIYVQEATELVEDEYETLTTRLRNGAMPYQQLLLDCNPGPPTHWLKQRAERGRLLMLESRHEDNPVLVDEHGAYTPEGVTYLEKLDALTGVRYQRLRAGIWAAAEGMVYEGWDPAVHLLQRDAVKLSTQWARYISVDFGYVNPFSASWWAVDHDGRLYRYRQIYFTQRLVEDHARQIKELSAGEVIRAVICDHDAEDRATLERHLEMRTVAAHKAIGPGIQAVQARLRAAGDGKPRLFFLRDSLVERDPWLEDHHLPCCTDEEFESYTWDTGNNRKKGEVPVDRDNHGLDETRYMVAELDLRGRPNLDSIDLSATGGQQVSKWR